MNLAPLLGACHRAPPQGNACVQGVLRMCCHAARATTSLHPKMVQTARCVSPAYASRASTSSPLRSTRQKIEELLVPTFTSAVLIHDAARPVLAGDRSQSDGSTARATSVGRSPCIDDFSPQRYQQLGASMSVCANRSFVLKMSKEHLAACVHGAEGLQEIFCPLVLLDETAPEILGRMFKSLATRAMFSSSRRPAPALTKSVARSLQTWLR